MIPLCRNLETGGDEKTRNKPHTHAHTHTQVWGVERDPRLSTARILRVEDMSSVYECVEVCAVKGLAVSGVEVVCEVQW